MTEAITVLTTLGPQMAKTWLADGSIGDYDDAKHFTVECVSVADINDLHALLARIERDPRKCIIRGKPREDLDMSHPVVRQMPNFNDQPSRLFMLDSDAFTPMLTDAPWASAEDLDAALTEFLTLLPVEFSCASYVWQASGSFGHPSKGSVLKGHLWFWLDEPMTCAQAEDWSKHVLGALADHTVHRCVQANYTARAIMSGGQCSPVAADAALSLRTSFLSDTLTLPPVSEADRQRMAAARAGRRDRKALVDPRDKPGVVGAFCRTYAPEQIVDLMPDQFTPGRSPDRITWVLGGGTPEGVGVSDSGTHLFSSHSTSPTGDRALNLYDWVRVYMFGHLDAGGDYSLDPTLAPSEKAMREWAMALPDVKAELDQWTLDNPQSEEEREAALQAKAQSEWADWQQALKDCEDARQVEGKLLSQMVRLHLSVFDMERAQKMIKEKLQALGCPAQEKTLSKAIKDAQRQFAESRNARMIDVEVAMAKRVLADHFGGEHGPHLKRFGQGWWMYVDGLWRPTEQDLVENRVANTVIKVKERGDASVKELAAFMAEAGRGDYLSSLINAVAGHLKRLCGGDDAHTDPLDLMGRNRGSVINCRNGELWFDDEGNLSFIEHNPAHNLTSQISCDYDPQATAPRFEAALRRVFSLCQDPDEMIRHWLELMGTIIQPRRTEAFWVMMKGPGGNGKSFLTEIIETLMGRGSCYKGSIAEVEKGSNNHFTASLVGKLMFFDDDVKKGVPLPDDWLKKLSEEKVLTANPKNKDTFEFVNRAIAVMLCNHWPHSVDMSHGMIRRAHVIETNFIIPKEQVHLGEQAYIKTHELEGVLNLLIQGWQRVLGRGGRFERPKEVLESIEKWTAKANLTQRFIGEVLVKSDRPGVRVTLVQAYQEYKNWIEVNEGSSARPVGRRSFDEALEAAGIEIKSVDHQKTLVGYLCRTFGGENAENDFPA